MTPAAETFDVSNPLAVDAPGLTFDVGGMLQAIGTIQHLDDPDRDDTRMYLFLRAARLRVYSTYNDYRFHLELGLGGEDAVAAPNPGVSLSLLDLNADIPIHGLGQSFIKVGQFKVPYSREGLTYLGYTQFADVSVDNIGFSPGYDIGASMNLRMGPALAMGGVFTGGGRDVPQEYLPEHLGVPLLAARVGWGDVDADPYYLHQNDLTTTSTRWGVFANGLYTKDTLIGHSSVLNVKLTDKSLLLNSNWNPFIAATPLSAGTLYQVGGDAAVRAPLGTHELSAEAEGNYAHFDNNAGALSLWGARVQGGLTFGPFELALRYAALKPDARFANSGKSITNGSLIQEVTPAVSFYLFGQNMKLTADLPILFNVPVFEEPGVGTYVGTQLPNQASVLAKTGTVSNQTVEEARLLFQAQF
jgi:hypothetical protein